MNYSVRTTKPMWHNEDLKINTVLSDSISSRRASIGCWADGQPVQNMGDGILDGGLQNND